MKRAGILFLMGVMLVFQSLTVGAKELNEYSIEEYLEVIDRYNEENGTELYIDDYNTFFENVVNVITPEELYLSFEEAPNNELIICKSEVKKKSIIDSEPVQVIGYKSDFGGGNYRALLESSIKTRFVGNKHKFVKLEDVKVSNYDNEKYAFMLRECNNTFFNQDRCDFTVTGAWKNKSTGISDAVFYTYVISFRAG